MPVSSYSKLTNKALVDALGKKRQQIKSLNDDADLLRKELFKRYSGDGAVLGIAFVAQIIHSSKLVLDVKKLEDDYGKRWVKKYRRKIPFNRIETMTMDKYRDVVDTKHKTLRASK